MLAVLVKKISQIILNTFYYLLFQTTVKLFNRYNISKFIDKYKSKYLNYNVPEKQIVKLLFYNCLKELRGII